MVSVPLVELAARVARTPTSAAHSAAAATNSSAKRNSLVCQRRVNEIRVIFNLLFNGEAGAQACASTPRSVVIGTSRAFELHWHGYRLWKRLEKFLSET